MHQSTIYLKAFWGSILLALLLLTACESQEKKVAITTIDSEFDASEDDWVVGLANYRTDSDTALIKWRNGSALLPAPLDTTSYGLYLSCTNLGDGATMYLSKKISGLKPSAAYELTVALTMASNIFADSVNTKGSPATMVYLKAGTSTVAPDTATLEGFYRLNVDMGAPSQENDRFKILGDISNSLALKEYHLVERSLPTPLSFMTNSSGETWLLIAVDSDYADITSLYFDRLRIDIRSSIE
ncbi:hypothetical protein CLV98_103128 [Dyadobacter jejuensis]|uniref:Uncharacterized protein n=1 Tax=Dyadobacter jejuensis TaxID=1082580 RepID=A0A316AMH4_9BACT|nr:hypothetical protein [Dyadobacter jejuensis]PWJ58761.1 hypothetical protein CLV98_103128 [Dyadobacter jejuensis]